MCPNQQVVLFDLGSAYWRLDGWRTDLWELAHIGIPDDDKESRDAIVFGYLTYWFLKEVHVYSIQAYMYRLTLPF